MAVSLPAEPNVALVRCQVRFLGRGAPADVPDGLIAIQKPLMELYDTVGIKGQLDTVLTVFTNGILAESPELAPADKWWPIQDLLECGAFKVVGGDVPFLPLTVIEENRLQSSGPALFAITFQRRDIPAADTWGFVTKSDQASIALVVAIRMAYSNRAGWGSSSSDRPPSSAASGQKSCAKQTVSPASSSSSSMYLPGSAGTFRGGYSEWDGAIVRRGLLDDKRVLRSYYEKPALNGYFYTPSSSLIQKYCVSEITKTVEPIPQPMPVINSAQPQQPDRCYGESELMIFTSQGGLQLLAPPAPQAPQATQAIGNVEETKKSHGKKKNKKKQRDSSDDSSDEDDPGSSVAVFTKQNGRRVVVVPEDTSVIVRPQRNTPRIPGPGAYEGQQNFVPGGRPVAESDALRDQRLDPRGGFGVPPWLGDGYLDPVDPIYESRIVPGFGGFVPPEIEFGPDPYIDEGPYERRLPVDGYGVEPDFYKPDPRNVTQFPEGPFERRLPAGRYGPADPYPSPYPEGPFERRLPVDGYGVEPDIYRPDPRNVVQFPERSFERRLPVGRYGPADPYPSPYPEGPFERRLPVGGYGVEPDIYRPDPRNGAQFPERWIPSNGPIPESNFILRPSDSYGRPVF